MESSWRFNVWNFGAWGDDFTLCSRLTGSPDFVVAGTAKGVPRYALLLLDPDPDRPYEIFQIRNKPAPFPSFPYGNTVDPD